MARWTRLLVTVTLALTVSTAAFANCLPGPSEPDSAMACCQGGHHDCGSAMQAVDCCKSHDASSHRLTAANPASVFKPIVCLIEIALPASLAVPSATPSPLIEPFVAFSPPLFLLDSSLRI